VHWDEERDAGGKRARHLVVPGAFGAFTVTEVEGPEADLMPTASPNTKYNNPNTSTTPMTTPKMPVAPESPFAVGLSPCNDW
jgi:hypothetical protein